MKMVDCNGIVVNIGDFVRYWHKREGSSRPDFGEITKYVSNVEVMIQYTTVNGQINTCIRRGSGITKMSMGEAMIYKLEKLATCEDMI